MRLPSPRHLTPRFMRARASLSCSRFSTRVGADMQAGQPGPGLEDWSPRRGSPVFYRSGYAARLKRLTGATPLAGGAEAVAPAFFPLFNGNPRRTWQPKTRGTLGDQFVYSWLGATVPLRGPFRCSAAINDGYGPRKRSPTAERRR